MINPLEPVFDWFIAFFTLLPQPIKAFLSLYWIFFLVIGVILVFWRTKH